MRAHMSIIARSWRQSAAVSASASSTKATWCMRWDSTGIAVLTQIQPISVLFTLPQQQLGRVNKAFAKGTVPAEATESDGKQVLDRGTLQVVNNQVDQMTGTVQLKAEFRNAGLQLWPGQFVNVRL